MEPIGTIVAALSGFAIGVAALRYLIRAEFERMLDRLDKRYSRKEDTNRRLAQLEEKVL